MRSSFCYRNTIFSLFSHCIFFFFVNFSCMINIICCSVAGFMQNLNSRKENRKIKIWKKSLFYYYLQVAKKIHNIFFQIFCRVTRTYPEKILRKNFLIFLSFSYRFSINFLIWSFFKFSQIYKFFQKFLDFVSKFLKHFFTKLFNFFNFFFKISWFFFKISCFFFFKISWFFFKIS